MIKLPFLEKQDKDTNRFLTVNINSNYIRCLVFYYDNGKLKIIGSGKQPLDTGKVRSGSIVFADHVAEALEKATLSALEEVGGEIEEAIVGVSGDLCLGLMTTIKAKRNGSLPIKQAEIDNLIKKINESAYLQAQSEYMQINGSTENELDTVTNSTVYTKLDNQKTTNIENKNASSIEMAVFNAFVPTYHLKAVQQTVSKAGLKILAIGAEMYCLAQTVIESKDESDFIVIEIDGDYTTGAVVFGKGIVATRTLNVGYYHFIEGVAEKMGITTLESEKMLKSYVQQKLTGSESTVVQNALRPVLETWLAGLELLFAEYSGVKTFAPKIYITGEGADLPDLWLLLNTLEWTKSIPFKDVPTLHKMTFMDLNKVSDATGKINASEWLPTASLGLIKLEMEQSND